MNLIKANYTSIWPVCEQLGLNSSFNDSPKRMEMVLSHFFLKYLILL